jgi:uncharacterized protein YcsI (UPF0317 family)
LGYIERMAISPVIGGMSPRQLREEFRSGRIVVPTAGLAPGFVQANLVIVPAVAADDFESFCRRNPRPCPLLERVRAGEFEPRQCAPGADLRTDLPRYRVFRDGRCEENPTSIEHVWRADLVSFLLGCSFTFENAMLRAGLPVRHVEEQRNVPMFRTNVACAPAGPFAGPLVVSMRPMTPGQARRAAEITAQYPLAHGAPIHAGDPAALGIADAARPDFGDPVTIRKGEIPVFWACGVTPMLALGHARLELAITHEPGHMFITDLRDESLRQSPS